jgi:hypothetical protein
VLERIIKLVETLPPSAKDGTAEHLDDVYDATEKRPT